MKKKARPERAQGRCGLLGSEKRERMLAIVIRDENAHAAVRDQLTPDVLKAFDVPLGTLWELVCRYRDVHSELPTKGILLAEIRDAAADDRDNLLEDEIEALEELVTEAFDGRHDEDSATSNAQAKWAIEAAQRLLEDQLAQKVHGAFGDPGMRPADLLGTLQGFTDGAGVIDGMSSLQVDLPFPEGWDTARQVKLYSTGISVLDRFLGGGHRGGEVYLFMGPYGSCKTTLAVMGLVEGARLAAAWMAESGRAKGLPLSVIVSYETPPAELRERCISYAASIPRKFLREAMSHERGLKSLNSSKGLREHDAAMFATRLRAGERVKGPGQRAREAADLFNRHAVFLDMSGADARRAGAGGGYVPEIARELDRVMRSRQGAYPVVVWVDYLGAMARRHIAASDRDYRDLRHLVSGGVMELASRVARRFECPVWVNHQLSGEANSRSPAALIDHTDAAEAKNAAENADFAIVAGTTTEDEQLCMLRCTKHRREPPRPDAIVRVDGDLSRVTDVSEDYAVDPLRREIVSRAARRGLQDVVPFAGRAGSGPAPGNKEHLG